MLSVLMMYPLSLLVGETVRLWFLCASDYGSASSEVTGGHSILDGTRGHRKAGIWNSGRCIIVTQCHA
jgi:hypothetical protein